MKPINRARLLELSYETPPSSLEISSATQANFFEAYYRFRLGSILAASGERHFGEQFHLLPGMSVRALSLEGFRLGLGVLGLVSTSTELFNRFIRLEHSATIDPGYPGMPSPGSLAIVLSNFGQEAVMLDGFMDLGKVMFFEFEPIKRSPKRSEADIRAENKWRVRGESHRQQQRDLREFANRNPDFSYVLDIPPDDGYLDPED